MDSTTVQRFTQAVGLLGVISIAAGGCGGWGVAAQSVAGPNARPPQAATEDTQPGRTVAAEALIESGHHPWLAWPEFPDSQAVLRELYAAEADGLFWFEDRQPVATLESAVAALAQADAYGLNASDYDAGALADRYARLAPATAPEEEVAEFDLAMSISAARFLRAVHEGRIDPKTIGFQYDVSPQRLDVGRALRSARERGLETAVREASPAFPVYERLMGALQRYRTIEAAGEPPAAPVLAGARKKIEPGAMWEGTAALAERLRVFGDLPAAESAGGPEAAFYGAALVDAVRRFQARHALEADGVIGASTIAALNVPLSRRVRQLELALERERWLPDTRHRSVIVVSVPFFRLWGYDPKLPDEPLQMKVVVGKSAGHATPLFVEEMEYIVFSPFWNPPPSILRNEIVPNARRDPDYLAQQNMELVAGADGDVPPLAATAANLDSVLKGEIFLRQRPGPKNSLGQAKFIFPNPDNVYMHGTPGKQLFARARRDLSHGCIRVEDAPSLAVWILREQPGWTRERIAAAMTGGMPVQVNLKERLTVLTVYDTVYVDSTGVLHFADDCYGHDARLEAALKKGYPYPRSS